MARTAATKGPIRRAQLIAPFGVGAMVVVRDGTSLIAAGLDHWYAVPPGGRDADVDAEEFKLEEWRLEKELGVSHFRLPPDWRKRSKYSHGPNHELTVPFLRFPGWHFCPSCHLLKEFPSTVQGRQNCPECEAQKRKRKMVQVPFISICEHGHIQDFPWREWVHEEKAPTCTKALRLISTGGATLGANRVQCECGKGRSLAGITDKTLNVTKDKGTESFYPCPGHKPWLALESTGCGAPLRGSLRTASNVYFAQVRSAVYLPRQTADTPPELVTTLRTPPISNLLGLMGTEVTAAQLRSIFPGQLQPYQNMQIEIALRIIRGEVNSTSQDDTDGLPGDDAETRFRRAEYEVLCTERNEDVLKIKSVPLSMYTADIARYFSRIMLVDKLTETRALTGFTRIYPDGKGLTELKSLLWRTPPSQDTWLPAYKVYGEGIFLQINEDMLRNWEIASGAAERVAPLAKRYEGLKKQRRLRDREIGPRFVLMHTLAHLLMNRLTFECGYSSAALRERLYVSTNPEAPMAGILIYTAAGDSEGTMGGLVRMGKPGYLEPVIRRALENAEWCSADPVCMEMGQHGGQGPDSCNLAACHNCGLVPETACEEFNQFLDRALVVGDLGNPALGFFKQ